MLHALSQFKEKYKNMSVVVKAGMWFTICNFLQRGITMITTPIFTRVLSTEEYGLYSTYLSWESILLLIVSLSLYKSMMNLYVKYKDKEMIVSAICGLTLIFTCIWAVIAVALQDKLAELMGISAELVVAMFVYFIFQSVVQCWSLYKRYVYNYKAVIGVTLLLTVGTSLFGCLAVLFVEATAVARAVANTAVYAVVGIVLYISVFKTGKTFYNKAVWKFALGFCVALLPHYLSEFILQSSDKIMINYMCGSSDVAIYSIAYSAGSLINLITNAINTTFSPYQYQKIEAKEYDILAKRANQVLGFVGVMLCVIMLFSKEIVLIFGGWKYIESTYVIIPICLGVYFNYLFQLFARVQEYYERKLTVVIPSIMCAALNLVLNYIFIQLCGYQAAAYTTFACYLIFCILHYFFYRKVCREILDGQHLYDIKGLVKISGLVIVAGIVISVINNFMIVKYVLIAAMVVLVIIKRKKVVEFVMQILKK